MKAIILAAGVGKRFKALTDPPAQMFDSGRRKNPARTHPGCSRSRWSQRSGHRDRLSWGHDCRRNRRALRRGVRALHQERAVRKGAILSLWSARKEFDTDLLIMDADVLFPVRLLQRLVQSPHASCFLLDASSENSGEEQMLLTRAGRVLTIIRGGLGRLRPDWRVGRFLKVARDAVPLLRSILDDCVAQGRDTIEHEEAFPVFLAQHHVGFEQVDDLPWTEIDFPQDLEHAERDILPAIERLDVFDLATRSA